MSANSPDPTGSIQVGRCGKCGGEQEAGCLMAPAYSLVGVLIHPNQAHWYAGQPTSGFWGTGVPPEKRQLTAFRCTACGLLEFYAE